MPKACDLCRRYEPDHSRDCLRRLADELPEAPIWIGTQRYPADEVPSRSDLAADHGA